MYHAFNGVTRTDGTSRPLQKEIMPIKKIFEAVPTHLIVVNKYTKGISLNRPGNMFFRSLKFRAGARQIQFRRGPDHGAAMVSSA